MNMAEKKKRCLGCRNNFYNGNNQYGIQECWSLQEAKLVLKRRVGMSERPPWTSRPVKVFDCRHEDGAIFVRPDQTC